jgi:hypothetical protein
MFFIFFFFFKNSEFYLLLRSTRSFGIADRQQKLSQQLAKPLAVVPHSSLFPFPTPISAVEVKAKALPLGLRNQSVEYLVSTSTKSLEFTLHSNYNRSPEL